VQVCAAAGVQMVVNHPRRWAPDIQRLRDELAAGQWGAVRAAIGIYNKGLFDSGAHLVDLLQMLLGPLELLAAGPPVFDHGPDDPTVPALLQSRHGVPVTLNAAHAADYAIFELQLLTERGLVAMEDGGAGWRVRRIVGTPHFKGCAVLDGGQRSAGDYLAAMLAAVRNVHGALTRNEPLASTGETALAAQRLCEQIAEAAQATAAARAARAAPAATLVPTAPALPILTPVHVPSAALPATPPAAPAAAPRRALAHAA